MNDLRWFAFTSAPQREKLAIEELGPFAAELRLPEHMRGVKRRNGSVRKRRWPLLVGYVFAGFDCRERFAAAREFLLPENEQRKALRRLVGDRHGRPLWLNRGVQVPPDFDVTMDYSKVELPEGVQRPMGWGVGDHVEVTAGPMAGRLGPVSRVSGERARVVFELFASFYEVEISVHDAVLAKRALTPVEAWEIGDPAQIMVGPFAGFVGVIEDLEDATARLTVDVMGRATPVDVPLEDLRRAPSVPLDGAARRSS